MHCFSISKNASHNHKSLRIFLRVVIGGLGLIQHWVVPWVLVRCQVVVLGSSRASGRQSLDMLVVIVRFRLPFIR